MVNKIIIRGPVKLKNMEYDYNLIYDFGEIGNFDSIHICCTQQSSKSTFLDI